MVIRNRLAALLAALVATSVATVSVTGCNKKEEETEEEAKPEPEEEPEEEVAEAPAEDSGEVKTDYEGMTPAGGTFRLLRQFNVHAEADASSKKLTRLASGTLVNFKNFYRDWILVEWPSGPGELSPGWIQTKPTSSVVTRVVDDDKKAEEDKKEDDKKAEEHKKEDDKKAEEDKKEDDKKAEEDKKEDDKKVTVKPKIRFRLPKLQPKK